MKQVVFHVEAEKELIASAEYYENRQTHLGTRFLLSIQESIAHIILNPRIYQKCLDEIRKCRVHTFPYGIIYEEFPDRIVIYAIVHLKRKPGYWKKRLPPPGQ